MSAVVNALSAGQVAQLETLYTLRDRAAVLDFVAAWPALLPVLFDAPQHIGIYFPAAPLTLELTTDPEDGGHQVLFVYITSDTEADQDLDLLDKLSDEWYFDLPAAVRNQFVVDTE